MIPFNSIVLLGLAVFVLIVLLRTIKIVPQKQVKIIERLGKYHRTAEAGLNTVVGARSASCTRPGTRRTCRCAPCRARAAARRRALDPGAADAPRLRDGELCLHGEPVGCSTATSPPNR